MASVSCSTSTPKAKRAKGVFVPPSVTPRRSPRLAVRRSACDSQLQRPGLSTPVRDSVRKFLLSGKGTLLDDLKQFIDDCECYRSLEAQLVTAESEVNELRKYILITRRVKCYDDDLGPYDAVRLVVEEGGAYKLLVYDKLLEENTVQAPFPSSSIVASLDKLADRGLIVCPGIKGYSTYKTSIGYDLKRAVTNNCPPNSARDSECTIIYDQPSTRKSPLCAKCVSLKWQLSKRKKEHDELTSTERLHRQSSSSKVAFDVLSPSSKRARFDNMRKTIHQLQSKVEYYSEKIERLSTNEVQNKEIGELVSSIISTPHGRQQLCEILTEAECKYEGLGSVLKGIWEKDTSEWQQFQSDQEKNS